MISKKNNFFPMAILTSLISVGLILIAVILWLDSKRKPQPNLPQFIPIDTSNWKTYRNEYYGFELKYPSSWYLVDLLGDKVYGYLLIHDKEVRWLESNPPQPDNWTMMISIVKEYAPPYNAIKERYFLAGKEGFKFISTMQVQDSNRSSFVICMIRPCPELEGPLKKVSIILPLKDDNHLLIGIEGSDEDYWIKAILSTFKFTN